MGGHWQVKREWLDKLHDFVTSCKLNGVKNVCEWHNEPDSYLRQMLRSAQVRTGRQPRFRQTGPGQRPGRGKP
ncbi:MAG: hypothetical protein ACLR8Y_00575 [Alistipes indistinctus]